MRQSDRMDRYDQALSQLDRERRRVADAAAFCAALEREARRLGMVKAGEKSYIVEDLPHR